MTVFHRELFTRGESVLKIASCITASISRVKRPNIPLITYKIKFEIIGIMVSGQHFHVNADLVNFWFNNYRDLPTNKMKA